MPSPNLEEVLRSNWDLEDPVLSALSGGMNSSAWAVDAEGMRYVLKVVNVQQTSGFLAGLQAATLLDAHGVPAGRPVPTTSGGPSVELDDGHAALLRWVDGSCLGDSDREVRLVGATLARVHTILLQAKIPTAPAFDWVDVTAAHLDFEPWLRPAVTEAVADWRAMRASVPTWCFLHGDPSPEAFLVDDEGTCGVIDWAGGFHGPCVYDLASAVMYVGPAKTPSVVDAYLHGGALPSSEVRRGLATLLRLRFAVQADYFARRLSINDLTGIADESENYKGLRDAQRMLATDVHDEYRFDTSSGLPRWHGTL